MKQIATDLWETDTEHVAPGLNTHAYLWVREGGNVLFYNTTLTHEYDRIAELGGVAHHYLSHEDEVGPVLGTIQKRFGNRLYIHSAEAETAARHASVDSFTDRHRSPAGFEVIPTPGHSPGSTSFLATASGRRYLFTGDTIGPDGTGAWVTGYFRGHGDPDAMLSSLDVYAELAPDFAVSSAFGGDSAVVDVTGGRWAGYLEQGRRHVLDGGSEIPG